MDLSVYSISGGETGRTVSLPDEVFAIAPNDHAIYLDVKQHLANKRQGTHKAKERAEVAYSTKKIKKQKGTGGARAGSIKSPVFTGGGRVFGPVPRDYSFKLNKKLKHLARRSALSYKATENSITLLEDFNFEAPKTKEYLKLLKSLSVDSKKTLLVVPESLPNIFLSLRNIPGASMMRARDLNTYDIMNADRLLVCEGSVEQFANF